MQRAIAAQSEAVHSAVAPDAPGSPLQRLRADLVAGLNESHLRLAGQITELRTALEVEKATSLTTGSAAAKAPAHGLYYETAVLDRLEQIAYTAGDSLTRTVTTPGAIPRALTRDAVIELAPSPAFPGRGASLVVEAKDRGPRASAAMWASELARARVNRNAVATPALLRSSGQMPGAPRRLHILSPIECLVAYDPAAGDDPDLLTAAYLLLRAHAWAAVLDDQGDTDLDLPALRAGLGDALQALAGFETLNRHSANARKQLDDLDKATTGLRNNLRARLESTQQLDPTQHSKAA